MSVRINFEIGHEAAIRTKRTQEGFTHDWEVFVRGCDGANIHYYVDKVVFYLHETFPKPKRVVKEPPYSVKESGYAGFTLPVEIHLRNKDEPKKICLNYDLHLQPSGAPISEVQSKKYVFSMPGDDFKLKLLKGGGVMVNSSSQDVSQEIRAVDEKSQLISKPRLGGTDLIKKHKLKVEDPRNSFQALFGAPITKTSKVSVEAKPISKDKNSNLSKSGSADKDKSKKHSPHKDKDKDKFRDKEDKSKREEKKREDKKERSKDHDDRIKDKRREKSPKIRSPTPTKRPSSPKRLPSPSAKHKEEKKIEVPKDKKLLDEREKLEKKIKKEKRDKEKKDGGKYKDRDQKFVDQKENKNLIKEKHKEDSVLLASKNGKEKTTKEKEVLKDYTKESREAATESIEKNGKLKTERPEEKIKHKHKKKDKDKKEKLTEKIHKSERKLVLKDPQKENEKANLFESPKQMTSSENRLADKSKKPLTALIAEFGESDSSHSSISSQEDLFSEPAPVHKMEPKKESIFEAGSRTEADKKVKKDKTKKNKEKKSEKNMEKRRKRKADASTLEAPLEKITKEESSNSKESDTENNFPRDKHVESEENYEDYMNILRDLQHKILTLQDNAELQRVVQLIAETGRFEVSAQTFDFDLCLLERSTITQLQNFFESAS